VAIRQHAKGKKELAPLRILSWNDIMEWLKEMDLIQPAQRRGLAQASISL